MTGEEVEKYFKSMNINSKSSNTNKCQKNGIEQKLLDELENRMIVKINELIKINNDKIENEITMKYSDIPNKKMIDDYILKATYKILKENMKMYYNKTEIDNKMIEYKNLMKETIENKFKMNNINSNSNNSNDGKKLFKRDNENIKLNEMNILIKKENEKYIEEQNIHSNKV